MESIVSARVSQFNPQSKEDYLNAVKETVQEIALYALSRTDFFDHAAFYGGTALRIFYSLPRFSEDLDFSLLAPDPAFRIERYFPELEKTFLSFGLRFMTLPKKKTEESTIQSAFLKGNTLENLLLITPESEIANQIQGNEAIKIKFEVDVCPPEEASIEYRYGSWPEPFRIRLYDESSLFAGKVHAVLCREWKKRVKGRDFFDFAFYVSRGCLLNVRHLQKRMEDSGNWDPRETLTLDETKQLLQKRFDAVDFSEAKKDVIPFLKNPETLAYFSSPYFKSLLTTLLDNEVILSTVRLDLSSLDYCQVKERLSSRCVLRASGRKEVFAFFTSLRAKYPKDALDDDVFALKEKSGSEALFYRVSCNSSDDFEMIFAKIDSRLGRYLDSLKTI
jgi:hypothetical protein